MSEHPCLCGDPWCGWCYPGNISEYDDDETEGESSASPRAAGGKLKRILRRRDRGAGFADPGGNSALRAATEGNPRSLPCPTCLAPNRLTPADAARGYQCDECAEAAERGW
tara:strand:+ start:2903 stop:3235 length:333 start_codon:yes stop_codon:yes gene_type:complete